MISLLFFTAFIIKSAMPRFYNIKTFLSGLNHFWVKGQELLDKTLLNLARETSGFDLK